MKVLLVEDDCIACLALDSVLRQCNCEVQTVHDGWSALRAFEADNGPRIAILDWVIPGLDGHELCRMIRQVYSQSYCYIVMLTARGEKRDIVAGLESGADDYLVKPVDFDELKARIGTARRILDMQDHLIASRDSFREQAMHDSVTGLWNRTVIDDTLRREWKRLQRQEGPIGVIVADIDQFKRINDTFGHPTGDRVLTEVAQRMSATLRPYDAIGRYGGDEFLIVLPNTDARETFAVADRLRHAVALRPIVSIGHAVDVAVTVSLGASASDALHAEPNALIIEADAALYRAKNTGRNRAELVVGLEAVHEVR